MLLTATNGLEQGTRHVNHSSVGFKIGDTNSQTLNATEIQARVRVRTRTDSTKDPYLATTMGFRGSSF